MVRVYEVPESRRWRGDDFELRVKVEGVESDAEARWAVLTNTPVLWDGRVRQLPTLEPDEAGIAGTWDALVPYRLNRKPKEIGDFTLSWSTGGGRERITQARRTVATFAPPGMDAPDNFDAIGMRPDGTVEGVDILVPDFRWTESYTVDPSMLTWGYAMTCAYLTRCINNDVYRGFAPGEVQFRGSHAQVRQSGTVEQPEVRAEIRYEFAAQPNVENQAIGDIAGISAKGWEYIDVRYEQVEDAGAKKLTTRPIAVYVLELYPPDDFSKLGIGA